MTSGRRSKRNRNQLKKQLATQNQSPDPTRRLPADTPVQALTAIHRSLKMTIGPIPEAETLHKYTPEQQAFILARADREQLHRHALDTKIVDAATSDYKWARVCGTIISLGMITAAVLIGIFGDHPFITVTLGLSAVVGQVLTFVFTYFFRKSENSDKAK